MFGLRAISAAVQPVPLWLRSRPAAGQTASQIAAHSPWPGVVALIILLVALGAALGPLHSRRLAALAAVTLVLSLGALVTYSSIPVRPTTLITLGYLIMLMLPLGVGCWLVTGTLIVLTVRWARARNSATAPAAPAQTRPHRPAQTRPHRPARNSRPVQAGCPPAGRVPWASPAPWSSPCWPC